MKIAVLSDIHSNLEAFREVIRDMERAGTDSAVCLGDCIGYGPDPEEVVALVRSLEIPTVMGNHELGIANPKILPWFNAPARKSLILTSRLISEKTIEWLRQLEPSLVFEGGLFVHGCPPDSILDYLFEVSDRKLALLMGAMEQRICFVGHTHTLEAVSFKDGKIDHWLPEEGISLLDMDTRYIINIGSVGQPRDGNSSAKYVIWDVSEHKLDLRFVPYDATRTAEKIIRLGFPRINADRLL
jgi:predicted phosphodiesterase